MKAGIASEAEVPLVGNDSLARVPPATNINKDIPVTTEDARLTINFSMWWPLFSPPEVIKESSFVNSKDSFVREFRRQFNS
jgi:hypothetical protein